MGCDIHMMSERRRPGTEQWINSDNFRESEYNPGTLELENFYCGRNYAAFNALSGVRNYSGRDDLVPLAEDRGVPDDMAPFTKMEVDRWGLDGHSHGWCTLAELRKYVAENNKTYYGGLVSAQEADKIDGNPGYCPSSWCQGSSDKTMVYRKWWVAGSPLQGILDAAEQHFLSVFPWKHQRTEEQADNFRLVFFYDN